MTAIAPSSNRTAVIVCAGVVVIAVGALVVARVVPQKLLISTALITLLATDVVLGRARDFGAVCVAVVVGGGAWAFGVWCSFRDFPLWPGLLPAAIVAAIAVVAGRAHAGDVVALAAKVTPLNAVMLVAMVLSWSFVKRGVFGFAVGAVFVAWAALRLYIEVAQMEADADDDDRTTRAALILGFLSDLAWNSLVCWARVAPDDDALDVGSVFGW